MQREEIHSLLDKIAVHYPTQKVTGEIIEEWYRLLSGMDYQIAVEKLDDYVSLETGNRFAPSIGWFKTHKTAKETADDVFHADINHQWHLEFAFWDEAHMHGRLYDQNDYEYVHDPLYEDGYHYDPIGRICTIDGRVIHA